LVIKENRVTQSFHEFLREVEREGARREEKGFEERRTRSIRRG